MPPPTQTAPSQPATAASDPGPAATDHRHRRRHGLQPPLHPLQLVGWAALVSLTTGTFVVLVPALPPPFQPPVTFAVSVTLLVHLVAHLAAALVDPAELELRKRRSVHVAQLDRAKHQHAIELGRCHLCDIAVAGGRTKHCGYCNKCVAGFDHHCKWLNQCIGARNYAAFFMCVSSACAAASMVAAISVTQLAVLGRTHAHQQQHNAKDQLPAFFDLNATSPSPTSSLPSSDAAFLAVVAALGLLAAITAGLLLHLCFFHIYISFLGLTTYEYIRQQRQPAPSVATNGKENDEEEEAEGGTNKGITVRATGLRHRPVNFKCGEERKRTTLFTCEVLEETFSRCSGGDDDGQEAEPTPTPPTTPSQDCQLCAVMGGTNAVAPQTAAAKTKTTTPAKKRRWNCCVSVPDSPDDPHTPTEPRCLISLCRHKAKSKALPTLEGRTHRTHGHWSSAKLRMLFRIIGNLGQTKRRPSQPQPSPAPPVARGNQVVPTTTTTIAAAEETPAPIQTISNLVPVPCYPDTVTTVTATAPGNRNEVHLPPLPPPNTARRRLISETELADALQVLQQQQQQRCGNRRPIYRWGRRRRRSAAHRTKTPALSPIRESGLSNPASPSRQSCAMAGACTRPF